jgi:uncharacterized protein (DUF3084 family)
MDQIQMSFSKAIDFVILGIRNGNHEAAIVLLEDLRPQVEAVIERALRAEGEVERLRAERELTG